MMSAAWIVVPLLEIITVIVFIILIVVLVIDYIIRLQLQGGPLPTTNPFLAPEFFALVRAFSYVEFVLGLFFAYMLFKLIKRRNTHFARQSYVYEDMTTVAKEVAAKKGTDVTLSLNNIQRALREARSEETEKNAVLWVILTLAGSIAALGGGTGAGGALLPGLATLYIFYFLNKDFFNHERREDAYFEEMNRMMMTLGVATTLPRRSYPTPSRGFVLYIVLTIVTIGFFWVYWTYTLLNDPNNHFRQQSMAEDTFIMQVTPLLA